MKNSQVINLNPVNSIQDPTMTVTEYKQIRNGIVVYSTSFEQKTTDLIISQPLNVYVGDPWYEAGTGFMVKNFYFEKVTFFNKKWPLKIFFRERQMESVSAPFEQKILLKSALMSTVLEKHRMR